jgi:hypothetical protein
MKPGFQGRLGMDSDFCWATVVSPHNIFRNRIVVYVYSICQNTAYRYIKGMKIIVLIPTYTICAFLRLCYNL